MSEQITKKKKFQKFKLIDIFRETICSDPCQESTQQKQINRIGLFADELAKQDTSFQKIHKLSWQGVPPVLRPKVWRYMLRYTLLKDEVKILQKKRKEYQDFTVKYEKNYDHLNQQEKKSFNTIKFDVQRIGTDYKCLCNSTIVENILTRLLFIWHSRNPASGYVQGICDLTCPLLVVFISEYLPVDLENMKLQVPLDTLSADTLMAIEADVFWCLSKMMNLVLSNYTKGFEGLQKAYSEISVLLKQIDEELYEHFQQQNVDLFGFAFKNISTMLLRLFTPVTGLRLFDTYLSYEQNYPAFMRFILIAILEKFANQMLCMKFEQLMTFIQKLPTKMWTAKDLQIIIAQAYVYQKVYGELGQ